MRFHGRNVIFSEVRALSLACFDGRENAGSREMNEAELGNGRFIFSRRSSRPMMTAHQLLMMVELCRLKIEIKQFSGTECSKYN